ncbi:MAG: hypothetical protein LBP50_05670, partial [Tannerella sp.]|nr:hypothetical protein [Tannerella sp.]
MKEKRVHPDAERTEGCALPSLSRGKSFYKISEIRRLLTENVIRRSDEYMQDLIKNHRLPDKYQVAPF